MPIKSCLVPCLNVVEMTLFGGEHSISPSWPLSNEYSRPSKAPEQTWLLMNHLVLFHHLKCLKPWLKMVKCAAVNHGNCGNSIKIASKT